MQPINGFIYSLREDEYNQQFLCSSFPSDSQKTKKQGMNTIILAELKI